MPPLLNAVPFRHPQASACLLHCVDNSSERDAHGYSRHSDTAQTRSEPYRTGNCSSCWTRFSTCTPGPSTQGESGSSNRTETSNHECIGTGQNGCSSTCALGQAEGEGCAKEDCSEENGWSEANESSHAQEIVGVDESTVGVEEERGVN